MIRSLYTGASGIKSHQVRMDVVGNNISNVNTVGYKSSRATFADILSQNIKGASASNGRVGSTNSKQIGLGTKVASIDLRFKDGAPMVTGKNTDLCLSGDGLFMVRRNNETYYTRDGAFEFDAEGNYVLPGSGHFVQGWMAEDGVIDTTTATQDIKIPRQAVFPSAETFTITGISVATGEPLNVSLGGKGFRIISVPDDGKTWRFQNDVKLGDTSAIIEDGNGNTRKVTLSPVANLEVAKGTDTNAGLVPVITKGSVTEQYPLTIIINGKQYTAISVNRDIERTPSLSLKSGGAMAGSNKITFTDGTNDITFTLDSPLEESIGQMEVTSAVASKENPVTLTLSDGTTVVKTDGTYEVGASTYKEIEAALKDIQIDSSGTITGIYTNGTRRTEAQVALAHFSNSGGLFKTGTSLYQESANSGIPVIGKAGEYGVVITPGALEMSNVDVASEFSDMIITQRGFQSNAKIITVGDEMIETAVNMKR